MYWTPTNPANPMNYTCGQFYGPPDCTSEEVSGEVAIASIAVTLLICAAMIGAAVWYARKL